MCIRDSNSPKKKPSRFIINFFTKTEEEAKEYEECYNLIKDRVKDVRDKSNDETARIKWWQHLRPRPELYSKVSECKKVIVIAATSKTTAFAFLPKDYVFSKATIVFPIEESTFFTILQSTLHHSCLLYTSPSPRDATLSRMPSSA